MKVYDLIKKMSVTNSNVYVSCLDVNTGQREEIYINKRRITNPIKNEFPNGATVQQIKMVDQNLIIFATMK